MSDKNLLRIITILEDNHVIKNITRTEFFNDDPHFFLYSIRLYAEGKSPLFAAGSSFKSPKIALIKGISEAIERYCLMQKVPNHKYDSYNNLKKIATDPTLFSHKFSIRSKKLSWIQGVKSLTKEAILIPSELVYLKPTIKKTYTFDYQPISTGAAAGLDHESALLNAIYEVIERDAFMNIYLSKIPAPKVDLNNFKDKTIQRIINLCARHKLELRVFLISTDLEIPCLLSILIDETGLGPAVSVGAKASFNVQDAIMGSTHEALMVRHGMRKNISNSVLHKHSTPLNKTFQRGYLWSDINMIHYLNFLLKENISITKLPQKTFKNQTEELDYVLNILQSKGYTVYHADITSQLFKKLGYYVYKVIIPGLQPLYLDEQFKKYVNQKRLKEVATYYSINKFQINNIPHPFL